MSEIALQDAESPLVLVLDAGSSSLRGALYDARARRVTGCGVQDQHPLHGTPDGGVEEDPDEVTDRIARVIDRVLAAAGGRADDIGAVGMASLASTLVGTDAGGRAVTPLYVYSDTRPAADVRALRAELDEAAIQQRTGCRLHTSYLPARLRWLARIRPATYAQVRHWMSLPEYVYRRFLGQLRAGYSIASWSGLLDRRTLEWDADWLRLLSLDPGCLSPLGDAPLSGLIPEYAQRWPSLAATPWIPGYADGAASNIGSGCLSPSEAALSIGTSGAMRVVMPAPPEMLPAGLWCYRVDRQRALVGGALNEGGGAVAWAQTLLRLDDFEKAEAQVGIAAPDAHGLTVLPFLTGERSPGWNADIRAAIVGLALSTRPVDVLQALMEAVAYRFAAIWRQLQMVAPDVRRVIASGGGAVRSPVWVRMIADVLGHAVSLSPEPEATSRGVAVLALQRIGAATEISEAAATTFETDGAHRARYTAAMARQQRLYDLLANGAVRP